MDTMRGALERAKMLVGMEVDEESGLPPPEEQSEDRHLAESRVERISEPKRKKKSLLAVADSQ